ncbi:MAG: aldo/keto reductase [Candidatus Omnitrophica bacterium]|nr:aldo/keto reductase [Candidatus Omnitrophota bacterium]
MKYRELGRSGLKVSEIGFGAWAIGGDAYGPTSDRESLEALEAAWDRGINFFDTADSYGKGRSESLLAQFLKGKPRGDVCVATKAGWDFYQAPVRKRFDAAYLGFALERSLRRLKAEAVDLFWLHNPPLELIQSGEAADVLKELKKAGKIRFGGISVHRVEEAQSALEFPEVEALQIPFNVMDTRMEAVFAEAVRKKTALAAREPLASGWLSGKYPADFEFPKGDHRRRWHADKLRADEEKFRLLCGVVPKAGWPKAALEFVLSRGEIASVLVGIKQAQQARDNAEASESPELTQNQIMALSRLFKEEPIFQQGLNPR